MGTRRTALAVVLACALAASCSGSGDGGAVGTTAAGPASTSTTAAPPGTSATTSSTTGPLPDGCGVGPRPAGMVAMSEAAGDFDGDGRGDALITYGLGTEASPAPWHLRVEPAAGNPIDIELPNPVVPVPVQALGGADLSGDGRGEAFAVVGGGATLRLVGVFALGLCTMTRVIGPDGQPSALALQGEPAHRRGIRCDGSRVFTLTADSDDGTNFRTGEGKLRYTNGTLVPDGAPTLGSLTSPADDGPLAAFSTVSCGFVTTPPLPTG